MNDGTNERGRAGIWILLGLLAGLAAIAGLLLFLMTGDDGDEGGAGAEALPEHPEHPEPEPGPPPPPGQPPTTRLPSTGQSLHRAAARHHALVKQLKRGADASAEPWEHDRGDGPKRPVTVTVHPTGKKLHPDVLLASRQLKPKISACYRHRLRAKPDLKGRVSVRFNVAVKEYVGVVNRSNVTTSQVKDFKMESCVLRALATMKLPAPLAGEDKWYNVSFDLDPSQRPATGKTETPTSPPGQPRASPPGEQPPGEQPPGEQPPGEQPPGEQPPGEQPPGEQPPREQPPGEQPPGEQPPPRE
jgi:hypothetical protein